MRKIRLRKGFTRRWVEMLPVSACEEFGLSRFKSNYLKTTTQPFKTQYAKYANMGRGTGKDPAGAIGA